MGTNGFLQNLQSRLGEDLLIAGEKAETNVDIVFVIDATQSMAPVLDKVKELSLSLYDNLVSKLSEMNQSINQLRAKIIAFRDYYCDGSLSIEESEFFYLPDDKYEFKRFISGIVAKGGGDDPESGLEALALAMRSDWIKEGSHKRHIIALFTDAPAHELEMQRNGIPKNYPKGMFQTYNEISEAWSTLQGTCLDMQMCKMDAKAKRLVLFAPSELYPWGAIARDFEQSYATTIERDCGGEELKLDAIINLLAKSSV